MSNTFTAAPEILGPNAEAIVSWWMSRYDLHEDDRDGAIGSLVMFTKGAGQPPTDLFVAFPEMAKAYYSALGK